MPLARPLHQIVDSGPWACVRLNANTVGFSEHMTKLLPRHRLSGIAAGDVFEPLMPRCVCLPLRIRDRQEGPVPEIASGLLLMYLASGPQVDEAICRVYVGTPASRACILGHQQAMLP